MEYETGKRLDRIEEKIELILMKIRPDLFENEQSQNEHKPNRTAV